MCAAVTEPEHQAATRVAAIDCGTNSLRLLIADVTDGTPPGVHEIDRRTEIVRLGEAVDRTGRFAPGALSRALGTLERYAGRIAATGATHVRMIATSATRDVTNRAEFLDRATRILGVPPEVVSGVDEALLAFTGATTSLPPDVPGPHLVVDLGGGSTELAMGTRAGGPPPSSREIAIRSIDVGSVRLTERHFRADPPAPSEIAAARRDVEAALDDAEVDVPLGNAASMVGLAGTVTTLAAIHTGFDTYQRSAVHHLRIPSDDVARLTDQLLAMTTAQRAAIPVMHPGRADVIAAGALVLRCMLEHAGLDHVIVSEHDILDGIALSLLPPYP